MNKHFAKKIKELRKENNLTQEQLGKLLNMTKTGISYWESGKSEPSFETIEELAEIFNVSISELIDSEYNDGFADTYNIPIYSYISCGDGIFNGNEINDIET